MTKENGSIIITTEVDAKELIDVMVVDVSNAFIQTKNIREEKGTEVNY